MDVCDKPRLREYHCACRECLSHEAVLQASAAVCNQLAAWPLLLAASTVLTYISFRNELDPNRLITDLPQIRWAVPRIVRGDMHVHVYDVEHLVRHRFGMLEPASDLPELPPADLDLVLVPGVAFDRQGARLGFGGGYYDRFLPTTPALRVGITYDDCLVDQLPCAEWDERMDWVVTPTIILPCHEPARQTMDSSVD